MTLRDKITQAACITDLTLRIRSNELFRMLEDLGSGKINLSNKNEKFNL